MKAVPIDTKKARNHAGCLAIAFLTVIISVASGYLFRTSASVSAVDELDACRVAQQFVADGLKAPSTAAFAPCREPDTTITQTNRAWIVRGWVDAENSFGAKIRNNYTAEMVYYTSTGDWSLVTLDMTSR